MAFKKLKIFYNLVRFQHTLFAMPFALMGAVLASRGIPPMNKLFWIIVAMVGARTGAMGLNRIIDADIDAKNPRTKDWPIPSGLISKNATLILVIISFLVLIVAAYNLNELCFKLVPFVIFILLIYSYTKRFTWLSHFILGLCLSLASTGAWIAIREEIDISIILLAIAIILWVSGFDILYAIQDIDFDRENSLHSIPQRLGIGKSLMISRILHSVMVILLISLIFFFHLGIYYIVGISLTAILLIYEHSSIREDDLSRLNFAFFNINGYISITIFLFTLADIWIGK
jgi:4-hydroxybenzoate polyprenyltransferase